MWSDVAAFDMSDKYKSFAHGETIKPDNVNYFRAMQKRSMEELGRKTVEEFKNAAKFHFHYGVLRKTAAQRN
jgi:hypothetical protein